jgi:glycosyltransferase involved in cell wall biosynthesis
VKLLIISHTEHHLRGGTLVGWGPTVREISHLAGIFESVTHIATLRPDPAPDSEIAYTSDRVRFVPLPPSGGSGLGAKLGILLAYPRYATVMLRELRALSADDVVHVRAPANVALLAMLLLVFVRQPARRWIKYAGNWHPDAPDAPSYRFQRWFLKTGLHRAQVTVNGEWEGDPPFVHSFINPCLTDEEARAGGGIARAKTLDDPLRLIFVGRLERAKGVERALRALAAVTARGIPAEIDLIGDGKERPELEALARELGIADRAHFHGWVARTAIAPYYQQAHLMLFPTNSSEGWPKVISEAMAYGVVPLAGSVSAIPQFLHAFGTGMALDPLDVDAYAEAIACYRDDPGRWRAESIHAVQAAERFTYTSFLGDVRRLLGLTD